jgi:hypothetical protein
MEGIDTGSTGPSRVSRRLRTKRLWVKAQCMSGWGQLSGLQTKETKKLIASQD